MTSDVTVRSATRGESVFVTTVRESAANGAINLAQGSFDHGPADVMLDALHGVDRDAHHQYVESHGHVELRTALAASVKLFDGVTIDRDTEVTVTAGATEAIYCTLAALVGDGGEVVLLEPAYEQYRPVVESVGGSVRTLDFSDPDSRLDREALDAVCGPTTRAIVVNSPWNPWGRMLDHDEWAALAAVAADRRVVIVSDETYEHLVLDGSTPRGVLAAVGDPELRVKISSASKTFAVTGWRVGWAIAGPELSRRIRARHQFITFCTAAPCQVAVARVLSDPRFPELRLRNIESVRVTVEWFTDSLREMGIDARLPDAGFYVVADVGMDAGVWCRSAMIDGGVAALPLSAFFADPPTAALSIVRFAICKSMPVLTESLARLSRRPELGRLGVDDLDPVPEPRSADPLVHHD